MIQFKLKPTIVTVQGAQIQIKSMTPSTKDDVVDVFGCIDDKGGLDLEGLAEADKDGKIKRAIVGLTNMTEEDVLNTPYVIQAEILAHIYKENLALFQKAAEAINQIMSPTTPQSSKS